MSTIWIVDDDQSIRFVLERALAREGFQTESFSNTKEVLEQLHCAAEGTRTVPNVLLSDIRMPGGSGLDLLPKAKELLPNLPIIIMTAFSDLDSAVATFQGGAFEYLAKPFDLPMAVSLIQRAVQENQREATLTEPQLSATEMLGQAPAMQDVFRAIGRLSQSAVTVLITGESGTGKELVANALHRHSPRGTAGGPFVAINTAAIPRDLLESELFGHERGAFTGANTTRRGRFEQADGGTLFLDEIGDMPFELQTRLLRVLSDGHFYRVGGHSVVKTNVRVIAATHQDLEQRVKQGLFREDLFHRLNVIRLRLPPLRERIEDIAALSQHFLAQSAAQLGVETKRISSPAMQVLEQYPFPGNVRQLENICHWLTVMAPSVTIDAKDLPPEVLDHHARHFQPSSQVEALSHEKDASHHEATPQELIKATAEKTGDYLSQSSDNPTSQPSRPIVTSTLTWDEALQQVAQEALFRGEKEIWANLQKDFERALIVAALHQLKGKRVEASLALGIGRNTITRKITELGLDKENNSRMKTSEVLAAEVTSRQDLLSSSELISQFGNLNQQDSGDVQDDSRPASKPYHWPSIPGTKAE